MAVGVLGVASVGFLAVRAVTGGSGGAPSPEAAAEQLAVALEAEDPIAALEVMDPDEVEALSEVVTSAAARAEELGFAPDDTTFGGVDIAINGARYEVDDIGDGVARVTITRGSADIDVDQSSLGRLTAAIFDLEARGDGEDPTDGTQVTADDITVATDDGEVEPFVVAVERGGGWYVSPAYTAAQYVVDSLGLDAPDLPAPDAREGAEDPEGAVRDLLAASGELDGRATGDLVAGPTGEVLRAYRGALEEWVTGDATDSSAEVDTLETEVSDRDGGGQRVVITELEGRVSWTEDGEEVTSSVSWDGTCLDVGDAVADDDDEVAQGPDDTEADFCLTDGWQRAGIEELAVVAVEEDGSWRVDPVATVADYAAAIVPELTEGLVLRALEIPEAAEPSDTIEPGEPRPVELNDAGVAVLALPAASGDRFTVTAQTDDEDEQVETYLVDPEGGYRSGFDIIEADTAGDYVLVVVTERWAPGEVTVGVSPVTEEALSVGEAADGEITAGAVVEYTADLDADSSYEIDLDNDDLAFEVVDPDGLAVSVEEDDDPDTTTSTFTAPASGTYRIRVDGGFAGATGPYRLTLDQGAPLVLGDGTSNEARGELTGPDSEQGITLFVAGGREVRADVTTTEPTLDMVVIIYDGDTNEELDRFDDVGPGEAEAVIFTPSADTTWYIAVQGKNDGTGEFFVEASLDA